MGKQKRTLASWLMIVAAIILTAVEVVIQLAPDLFTSVMPKGVFGLIAGAIGAAAFITRLEVQKEELNGIETED